MLLKKYIINLFLKYFPSSLVKLLKKKKYFKPLNFYFDKLISNVICIDVGASFFEHMRWQLFLNNKKTIWVAVEPNEKNITYKNNWIWSSKLELIPRGVSENGKIKDLYVTKIESGSSLLKPDVKNNNYLRFQNMKKTHFPYQKKEIDTLKLSELIKFRIDNTFFIKLDVQGIELSILKEVKNFFKEKIILGIETEASLLSSSLYKGSCKFYEINDFFDKLGYDLIFINTIKFKSYIIKSEKSNRVPIECDCVFIPKLDDIFKMKNESKLNLLAFLSCYNLYEDIKIIIDNDIYLQKIIKEKINYKKFYKTLVNLI